MSNASGGGSGSTAPQKFQTLAIEPSGSRGLTDKATGPRTEQGRQRTSRNATEHGVLSKVVVLKGESRAEYEELLTRLQETLQPEGTLEELLVEKLAALTWRQRRMLLAEGAEIRKNMEFVESDQRDREREEAERIAKLLDPLHNHGLIGKINNPNVLERCLELLAQLRKQFEEDGFNLEYDKQILEKIYGDRDENRLRADLYESYEDWLVTSGVPEEERVREGYASLEQCRKNMLQDIDEEIRCLQQNQKARAAIQTVRTQLEIVSRNVPNSQGLIVCSARRRVSSGLSTGRSVNSNACNGCGWANRFCPNSKCTIRRPEDGGC